jgi:2'-5' RNA ligase
MPSKRLFVAIAIPPEIRKALAASKESFDMPGLSWVREENLHITLLFIGDTEENTIASLEEKLSALSVLRPFTLLCKEVQPVSRRGKLAMIWASFEESPAFVELATGVSNVLNHPPDYTPLPHVTLARVKRGHFIKTDKSSITRELFYQWQVHSFGLWSSVLTPQGSIYKVINEWQLTGSL